jgi:hypothetical protein
LFVQNLNFRSIIFFFCGCWCCVMMLMLRLIFTYFSPLYLCYFLLENEVSCYPNLYHCIMDLAISIIRNLKITLLCSVCFAHLFLSPHFSRHSIIRLNFTLALLYSLTTQLNSTLKLVLILFFSCFRKWVTTTTREKIFF